MFTQEEINQLLANKNVFRCSAKSITFTKEFKLTAINKSYQDRYSPRMIFKEAGFSAAIINGKRMKDCINGWKRIYRKKGDQAFVQENRGRSKNGGRIKFKDKEEEIKYLKTKVKYLKAENDFLAKLRGLKRE